MGTQEKQRFKLKQEPIDNWSIREKLALAAGVQKNGTQNWGPIIRQLKAFAEKDRPADWFSPKFCALQYNDMFDKIEAPKRKRGERGEETTQDLIVKKYSAERIEELEKSLNKGLGELNKLKETLDILESHKYDEKFFKEVCKDIKNQLNIDKEKEIAYKNYLAEREMKISQMSSKFRTISTPKQTSRSEPLFVLSEELSEKLLKENDNENVSTSSYNVDVSIISPVEINIDSIQSPKSIKSPNNDPRTIIIDNNIKNEDKNIKEENTEKDIVKNDNPSLSSINTNENKNIDSELENIDNEATTEESTSETFETIVDDVSLNDKNPPLVLEESKVLQNENIVQSNLKNNRENRESTQIIFDKNNVQLKNSSLEVSTNESVLSSTEEVEITKKRRRRNTAQNLSLLPNRNVATRSSRSLNNKLETEESIKENIVIKSESESTKSLNKKRANSVEESSIYSEESSESKSLDDQMLSNPDFDEKWKRSVLSKIRLIQSNVHIKKYQNSLKSSLIKNGFHNKIDLSLIKKNIEIGKTKRNDELKRDLMLLFINVIMFNNNDSVCAKSIIELEKEMFVQFEADNNIRTRKKVTQSQTEDSSSARKKRSTLTEADKSRAKLK